MFDVFAAYYDLIYSPFKDYAGETARVAALLRRLNPRCRTVLDVACGTGEHARRLAAEGFSVDGLDLSPAFVAIARQKHPGGRFFVADMSDFDLHRQYDALLCLFSSIGYLRTIDRVIAALACFRKHVAPGGVVVVEPWFEPGVLDPARVMRHEGEAEGVHITRDSRVEIDGRLSRLHFDYEIADAAGTRHVGEVHELGLFTTAETIAAFRAAGFTVEHDPEGLIGRGLYMGRLPEGANP